VTVGRRYRKWKRTR